MAEAMDAFGGPIVASHHNCRALVPHPRQLTDQQIRRIVEHGGVIGIAADAWMLRAGWSTGTTPRREVPMSTLVDHIDHICQLTGGCEHVGIGSDLDGGFGNEETPEGLDSIGDLHKLDGLLKQRGYGDGDIDAIFYGNWLRFFRRHLPKST
jgi:membrane dipeptidase